MPNGKRVNHSIEFKEKIIAEVKEGKMSVPKIARKHGLNNSIIYVWLGRTQKGSHRKKSHKEGPKNAYPDVLRQAVLAEYDKKTMRVNELALKHKVHPSSVYWWVRERAGNTAIKPRLSTIQKQLGVSSNDETAIAKPNGDNYLRDVAIYLRHSRSAVNDALRSGKVKNYDKAHLLMLLALAEMESHGH